MIFDEQISRKPDHYPWTQEFIAAMHNGFWTHKEFNFSSDIQDFRVSLTEQERQIVTRALSTIGQLEISVKKFWAKLGDNLPHPSINDMGYVMANTEVIHGDAYERLLEVLGIDHAFDDILKLDIIKGRVNYLRKHLHKFHDNNKKQFIYSLILFTLFVENIALFSQFYTISFFGRYKNLLKDTNKQVEYTSREECFIEGTEVLTPNGWVDFRNIKENDDIVQYTPEGLLEFTKVIHKTEKNYDGNIITFSRSGNKCSVTPNHDMVFFDHKGNFRKKTASDLKLHKQVHIPNWGKLNNDGDNFLSYEDRLKIAIQADGTKTYWTNKAGEKVKRGKNGGYTHVINIKKDRKIERLDWILDKSDIQYCKAEPDNGGYVKYYLYFNNDFDYKTFDWIDLKGKSMEWCEDFIQEVIEWDGYKTEWGTGYCSTNKDCIDKVQTIAIYAGYVTSFYANIKKGYEDKPCYKLGMRKLETYPISHGVKKEISSYKGKVYCVSVPSGAIVTRLEGKTFIAGNCLHFMAGSKIINTLKEEYPELFDAELKAKIEHEASDAVKYECQIIEWIVNGYDHDKLNSPLLKEFIKHRMNESLKQIGYDSIFEVDTEIIKKTIWFDEQILGNNSTDFFHSRPVEYAKSTQSFTEEDLF